MTQPRHHRREFSLNIKSLKRLASILGVSEKELIAVASHSGAYYRPFKKTDKSRPFAIKKCVSKQRIIDNPVCILKSIQTRIYERLLATLPWPEYIVGGVRGQSVLINASKHVGASALVTIDVKSFFPSISNRHIYKIWSDFLGCSSKVAKLLTQLTTFERHLPQGAPTSSALANLVVFSIDEPIRAFCSKNKIQYSTWIDDLAFSGKNARSVINKVVEVLQNSGFKVSHKKLKIMPAHTRQILTGITVNKKPGLLKRRVSNIRSGIHKLTTGEVSPVEIPNYVKKLTGGIAYINSINSTLAEKLKLQLQNELVNLKSV